MVCIKFYFQFTELLNFLFELDVECRMDSLMAPVVNHAFLVRPNSFVDCVVTAAVVELRRGKIKVIRWRLVAPPYE